MKRALVLTALGVTLLGATRASAHGGLPISQGRIRSPATTKSYVPVAFWGLWIGEEGKPWTWICEEVINTQRTRRYSLSTDGTFYVTDSVGMERSLDHGCTWTKVTGEIASRRMVDATTATTDGATAWAVSADGNPVGDAGTTDNGVFVTHDHGDTWVRSGFPATDRQLVSVRVAPSSDQIVYVSSVYARGPYAPQLHRTDNGGTSFVAHNLDYLIDGNAPSDVQILAIDPRNPDVVYVRVQVNSIVDGGERAQQSLLRSIDGGTTFSSLWTMDGQTTSLGTSRGIDGVAVDAGRGLVFVATAKGLLVGTDAGSAATVTLAPTGNLSQAQCVDVQGSTIYACANNFAPDQAAIARSDDGGKTFTSVLRFADTEGPVMCPAGTPVGDQCPYFWLTYGAQLGIPVEAGDGGMTPTPSPGCGCELGGSPASLVPLLVALLGLGLWARRRAR